MFEAPRQSRTAGTADVAGRFAPFAELDLHRLWSLVWRGKTTILRATAVTLAAALVFLLVSPRQYTAVTELLIDPSDLRAVGGELAPTNQFGDAALLQVESQSRVLTSDSVLGRVVDDQQLANDPEFSKTPLIRELFNGLRGMIGLSESAAADRSLVALDEFKRHVKVMRTDRTYVIDVDVSSKDPEKAARLANAIADAYLAEQTQARADAARQISQSLSSRLKELQDRVRDAEDKAEAFKAQNNIVDANGQLVNEQQLSELDRLLEAARSRTAEAKARYEQVERVQQSKDPTGAFPEAVQSATITALRTQYAEIMRREAEQMTTLGARHPAVLDIQAQAERLRLMITEEVTRIALSARNEYETAKANQETLEQNLETLKHTTIDTSQAMVGLRELEREAQASRALYEAFLSRARETGEQERLDTKNIQVITKAVPPLNRSWPPPNPIIALAALLVGIASGTGIVLMRASSDEGSPRSEAGGLFRRKWRKRVAAAPTIPVLAVLPEIDVAYGLNALGEPDSRLAREIRKVYETLRASHGANGNPRILVVASDDDDDSAAVTLMLATQAAASQRVLLLDADIQRRTLSAIDADRNEAGLVDVATGRRLLADAIIHDRETDVNLLSFVAPNSRRNRPISDADIERVFNQTRRFDVVIVAAMDVRRDPSARFFAGLVDHIVLVARPDAQSKDEAERFVSRLGLDAGKVRGAILTGVAA